MQTIRKYIRNIISEDVNPGVYSSVDDMALLVDRGLYFTAYTLYKPSYYAKKIKSQVKKAKEHYASVTFKDKDDTFKDYYSFANLADIFRDDSGIFGYIEVHKGRLKGLVGSCYGANEIVDVNARDGYETFMFDVALHNHSPIMPNREKMSKNASELWTYYSAKRKDVKVKRFKNEKGAHPKNDADCEVYGYAPLDQSFSKEKVSHIRNLEERHKRFLEQMKVFLKNNEVKFLKTRAEEFMADSGEIFLHSHDEDEDWIRQDKKDIGST